MTEGAMCYLESIRRSFPGFSVREQRFLRDFEDSIYSFGEEHPKSDEKEFAKVFGTPQEVMLDFYDHSGLELYQELLQWCK